MKLLPVQIDIILVSLLRLIQSKVPKNPYIIETPEMARNRSEEYQTAYRIAAHPEDILSCEMGLDTVPRAFLSCHSQANR